MHDANGFDEHQADAPQSVAKVVRETTAALLAKSPQPPSTLNVRVGDVSVEMGWTPPALTQVAPVVPLATPPAAAAPVA